MWKKQVNFVEFTNKKMKKNGRFFLKNTHFLDFKNIRL